MRSHQHDLINQNSILSQPEHHCFLERDASRVKFVGDSRKTGTSASWGPGSYVMYQRRGRMYLLQNFSSGADLKAPWLLCCAWCPKGKTPPLCTEGGHAHHLAHRLPPAPSAFCTSISSSKLFSVPMQIMLLKMNEGKGRKDGMRGRVILGKYAWLQDDLPLVAVKHSHDKRSMNRAIFQENLFPWT